MRSSSTETLSIERALDVLRSAIWVRLSISEGPASACADRMLQPSFLRAERRFSPSARYWTTNAAEAKPNSAKVEDQSDRFPLSGYAHFTSAGTYGSGGPARIGVLACVVTIASTPRSRPQNVFGGRQARRSLPKRSFAFRSSSALSTEAV
jgi:hypothetical protein